MHILVFLDTFVYFWSETAMVDNQRKAVLFGNNFQSFLISSQSMLGQSHNISAILAESVLCQISIFCVWNVLFRLKLTFFRAEIWGAHANVGTQGEMSKFKSLPNLILRKISIPDHAQLAVGWSLIQAEVFPLALTAGSLLLLSAPTKQKVCVYRGGTAVLCHTKGSWSPAACLQQWLITHGKSSTWRQMYSNTSPRCSPVSHNLQFRGLSEVDLVSLLHFSFFFHTLFFAVFKPCEHVVSTSSCGKDFHSVTTYCVNRHILLCAFLAAFIWCSWYL